MSRALSSNGESGRSRHNLLAFYVFVLDLDPEVQSTDFPVVHANDLCPGTRGDAFVAELSFQSYALESLRDEFPATGPVRRVGEGS